MPGDLFEGSVKRWLEEQAPQGIVITDDALCVRDWNAWMEAHSGISRESVIGRRLYDLFPELVERGLNALYEDVLRGQVRLMAHRFHRYLISMPVASESDFSNMQQTAHIAPLLSRDSIIGTITMISDVTERVARERELHAARDVAQAANHAKDRFIAMLSHDLRTPLNSILGWVHVLRARGLGGEIEERAIRGIEQSTLIQVRLIDDLLDLNRIAAGKLQLERESSDLKKVVEEACELLSPAFKAKNIQFSRNLPAESRPCWIDSKRMHQVVWNLIANAVKFTPAGGSVRVVLAYKPDAAELSVSDNGVGLSEETLNQVFEPMWQATSGAASQDGIGLGLAIVRRVVELHGGKVRAESLGPAQGATFIVEIPFSEIQPPEPERHPDNLAST